MSPNPAVDDFPFPKMRYVGSLEGTNWLLDCVHQTVELRFYVLPWVAMREHCCWCHGVIGFIHYHSKQKSIRKFRVALLNTWTCFCLTLRTCAFWSIGFSDPDISKQKIWSGRLLCIRQRPLLSSILASKIFMVPAGPNYGYYGWVCWYIYIYILIVS